MKKYTKPEVEVCQIEAPKIMSASTLKGDYDSSLPLNSDEFHFEIFDEN